MWRDNSEAVMVGMEINVVGKSGRERPKMMWIAVIERDM